MKRLSDYKDEQALDLWAELLEPIAMILSDKELQNIYKNQPKVKVATYILKNHQTETMQVLKAIDDTPLTAMNLIQRVIDLILDIEKAPEFKDFFKSAEQVTEVSGITGSATANIEDNAN